MHERCPPARSRRFTMNWWDAMWTKSKRKYIVFTFISYRYSQWDYLLFMIWPSQEKRQQKASSHGTLVSRIHTQTYLAEVDVDARKAKRVESNVSRHGPIQVLRLRHEGNRLAVGHHVHRGGRGDSAREWSRGHKTRGARDERGERSNGSLHL